MKSRWFCCKGDELRTPHRSWLCHGQSETLLVRTIEEMLEEVLQGVPRQMFSDLLKQKLEAQDVKLSTVELEALTKEILLGDKKSILLRSASEDDLDRKITLDFSSKDIEQIEQELASFYENGLPQ